MFASPARKRLKITPEPATPSGRLREPKSTPRRASYLSPTKASLARHNPHLLPRPKSAGAGISPGSRRATFDTLRSQDGSAGVEDDASSTMVQEARMRGKRARDYVLGRDVSDDIEQGRLGDRARELDYVEDEDGLPPTPIGDAAWNDEPPRGILFSTPSKRLGKRLGKPVVEKGREVLAERELLPNADLKTSQADPEAAVAKDGKQSFARESSQRGVRHKEQANDDPTDEGEPDEGSEAEVRASHVRQQMQPLPEPDPAHEADSKHKRELQKEIQAIEHEISRYERQLEISRSYDWKDGSVEDETINELIAVLAADPAAPPQKAEKKPTSLSRILTSFLPFSNALPAPSAEDGDDDDEDPAPIPTHTPVELSDPLPYLRLFTPLRLTSSLTLIPNPQSKPLSQPEVHQLNVTLSVPHHFLSASLDLILLPGSTSSVSQSSHPQDGDSTTSASKDSPRLYSLSVPNLSSWARPELGTYLAACADSRDLAAATWAVASYWRIARRRATCWARCAAAFPDLVSDAIETLPRTTAETLTEKRRRGDGEEDTRSPTETGWKPNREALTRWLGRDVLVLQRDAVALRIAWEIGFDWTGEAESRVRAWAEVSQEWRKADTRGSLRKVGETFDGIMRERGVYEAVRVMVGLFFSE